MRDHRHRARAGGGERVGGDLGGRDRDRDDIVGPQVAAARAGDVRDGQRAELAEQPAVKPTGSPKVSSRTASCMRWRAVARWNGIAPTR